MTLTPEVMPSGGQTGLPLSGRGGDIGSAVGAAPGEDPYHERG
jgi:hypothetical protein